MKTNPPNYSLAESSIAAFDKLAYELALNYYQASTLDFDNIYSKKGKKWKQAETSLRRNLFPKDSPQAYPDARGNDLGSDKPSHSRNILVLGAGCSKNAFDDILTGDEARDEIFKSVIVGQTSEGKEVSLGYLLQKFGKEIKNIRTVFTGQKPLITDPEIDRYLDPILESIRHKESSEGNQWIVETPKKFFEEYSKLNLYSSDYNSGEGLDFESSLNLLAKSISVTTVRKEIQSIYKKRYAPTLFYEIIAHLFKHRFIDVIINFNFDELLDQALEDELSPESYDVILSDGDCRSIDDISRNGRLRQPLYIKPHGTASHKSTLRFTKDHYFEMPLDMKSFLEELVSCKSANDEKVTVTKKVNLISIGFEMASLEFNDILNTSLPAHSNFFYFHHLSSDQQKRVLEDGGAKERENLIKKFDKRIIQRQGKISPNHFYIIPLLTPYTTDALPFDFQSLGNLFYSLHKKTQSYFSKTHLQPRAISRHLITASLFGTRALWKSIPKKADDNPEERKNQNFYIKSYFESENYFMDRVLVEILIHMLFNNGRIDPPLLMNGRTGKYYSLYFDKLASKDKSGNKPKTLSEILDFFSHPSLKMQTPYKSLEILHLKYFGYGSFEKFFDATLQKSKVPNSLFSKGFSTFLRSLSLQQKDFLKDTFEKVGRSMRSTIQSQMRTKDYHIFQEYNVTDLISTELALDIHFYDLIHNWGSKTILMVADYGVQLNKFLEDIVAKDCRVYLILEDYKEVKEESIEENIPWYEEMKKSSLEGIRKQSNLPANVNLSDYISILYRPINRHNHHMSIFLDDSGKSQRVIYYHKQGLSRAINPMRIIEPKNIDYLIDKFEAYSKSARNYRDTPEVRWYKRKRPI